MILYYLIKYSRFQKHLGLYVLIMSSTRFRVNPHFIVAWIFLLESTKENKCQGSQGIRVIQNKRAYYLVKHFLHYTNHLSGFTLITIIRSSRLERFFKIGFLKNFAILTGKHLCWSLFLIKLQAFRPSGLQLYWKNTSTQIFSCENCETFKNSFFYRTPHVADPWFNIWAYLGPCQASMTDLFCGNT